MSDIAKLFRFKKKVNIVDSSGKILDTVYMRLVGDSDYTQARQMSLSASRQLRIKLRDKNTPEYIANFSDLDVLQKEEMVNAIVASEIPDYRDEWILQTGIEKLPELNIDNPTLEQQEEHQKAVEDYRKDRQKQLTDFMLKKSEERRKELLEKPDEDIKNRYIMSTINARCIDAFTGVFRDYCVYKGTFKDDKYTQLAFDNFVEFQESAPQLRNQLLAAYTELEIGGEDLKNL